MNKLVPVQLNGQKFKHPKVTADGAERASVTLSKPETLWFNTGTLCNIACPNCYIHSSPSNDRLVYINAKEVAHFLDQIDDRKWPVREIGFTGGEPFMNPEMIDLTRISLSRGYQVLILTNAMQPMMRKSMQNGLLTLQNNFANQLTLRISLDHWSAAKHDRERGKGSFLKTLKGMGWLRDNGIKMTVAGRTVWEESDTQSRRGYAQLFAENDFDINASDPAQCVLFPEMDETVEVPEITTACWDILGKPADSPMCASSRMVVKRKGSDAPSVVACTLLAYDRQFEMGSSLKEAEEKVWLNHPHCAKFCVLGGASCSG